MAETWRALRPTDVGELAALTRVVSDADDTNSAAPEEVLAQMFEAPRFAPETDSVGLWVDDELVGCGTVFGRDEPVEGRAMMMLDGSIRPDHRGRGHGQALLDRLQARGAQMAAEQLPGVPVRLRTSGGKADSSAQRLLEANGYLPDNYFVTMEAAIAEWVDPQTPSVATVPDAAQLAACRDAHNDAFRDHRNFSTTPADVWEHWTGLPTFRRDLCQVVVEDGRVVAYALTGEHEPGVAHVELVGTRREARGRGLARQVLVAALRAARDSGCHLSELEVDSTSPTSADRLYLSAGYHPVRTISRYVRDLPGDGVS